MKFWKILLTFLLSAWLISAGQSQVEAQTDKVQVQIRYISESGASLAELSGGAKGQGVLLYYVAGRGVDYPTLVVRLSKTDGASEAKAEVYQPQPGRDNVTVKIENNRVQVDTPYAPAIVIKALGGWWKHDKLVNYNLDIKLNAPMYGMWGAGYDPKFGLQGWASAVKYGDEAVSIQVRDPQGEGLPKWDWRTLTPPFGSRGYYHTNYAERKCSSPTKIEQGITPEWPFVAENGGYEQPVGTLLPPIVVDWNKGLISHFSELVTVRNQNCSYSFYALDQMKAGELNHPNFETPFAFYDLSGAGQGYPNLVMRTERYPANDQWSSLLDASMRGRTAPRDFETIRYSWRNAVGDGNWDYKVELLGFQPYTGNTTVAGGAFRVDAPSYEEYPNWAISKSWPAATFVSPETAYTSSEGIYDWTPRSFGVTYLFGWQDQPDLSGFADIKNGLRGEYRYKGGAAPKLYFSPVDNRLHLLGAEGGLWRLDANRVLRLQNLNGGNYLNSWTVERLPEIPAAKNAPAQLPNGEIEQALYQLNNYLIYSGPTGVTIQKSNAGQSLFETLPPTDKASWQKSRDQLAPYTNQKRDQNNLAGWLDAFSGETARLGDARIEDMRTTSEGFRFVLKLGANFQKQGTNFSGLEKLGTGDYAVTFSGDKFQLEPLTPAQPVALLPVNGLRQLEQTTLPLMLRNNGQQDIKQATLELWAKPIGSEESLIVTKTVSLPARQSLTTNIQWQPPLDGQWTFTPKLKMSDGQTTVLAPIEVQIAPLKETTLPAVLSVSSITTALGLALAAMVIFVGIVGLVVFKQWRLARMEQFDDADKF